MKPETFELAELGDWLAYLKECQTKDPALSFELNADTVLGFALGVRYCSPPSKEAKDGA